MVQNIIIRILLIPFSLLYGLGVALHNFFYRIGALRGVEFNLPVIGVGNLSVGGAGKSPHIEYMIRTLKDYVHLATLSRGYKRKTKGYLSVHLTHDASSVGDEPLQFKRKYPDILVAVAENRVFAISKILMDAPETQVILLDDTFQHRAVSPGLNLLLTKYSLPFYKDFLMPSGRLREWRSAYERADGIIVTKCPEKISEPQRQRFVQDIKPFPHQKIFFSYYKYLAPFYIFNPSMKISISEETQVLLVSAIASTDYLLDYVNSVAGEVRSMEFEDHHYFSNFDLSNLNRQFIRMGGENTIILTTEKDAMRLELHKEFIMENNLPIFVLPVEVVFHPNQTHSFDAYVKAFLLEFKS